jgi:3-dehydroquinate dehydratase-2
MKKKILLVNGPNINLLSLREPGIYGHTTLSEIEIGITSYFAKNGFDCLVYQSNHEGEIIDFLHKNREADYLIINPAGLTHTSVSLKDALAGIDIPFIEVHISNIYAREEFRHHSYLSALANGILTGCGVQGYYLAAELIRQRLQEHTSQN